MTPCRPSVKTPLTDKATQGLRYFRLGRKLQVCLIISLSFPFLIFPPLSFASFPTLPYVFSLFPFSFFPPTSLNPAKVSRRALSFQIGDVRFSFLLSAPFLPFPSFPSPSLPILSHPLLCGIPSSLSSFDPTPPTPNPAMESEDALNSPADPGRARPTTVSDAF